MSEPPSDPWPAQKRPEWPAQPARQSGPDQAQERIRAEADERALPQPYTPPPPNVPPPPAHGQPMAYGHGQPMYQPPGYRQVAPLNAGLAVIASLFIPGLGSMISHRAGKGTLILCSYIVACISIIVLVGIFLAPIVWIYGMVAGYNDANRWNREHGIVS